MCQLKFYTEYKAFKKLFQPLFSTHNNVLRGALAMREHNVARQRKPFENLYCQKWTG